MTDAIRQAYEHLKAGIQALRDAGVVVPIELHRSAQVLHHALHSE